MATFGKVTVRNGSYWWWREHDKAVWKVVHIHGDHIRRFHAPPIKLPGEGEFGDIINTPRDMIPTRAHPLPRNRPITQRPV